MVPLEPDKKIQTRSIEVNTYEQDNQKLIVEGELKDRHLNPYRLATGEKRPAGIVHHFSIRLLLDIPSFMIEEIDVQMLNVPHQECLEIADSLSPVRGLRITGGFALKLRELAGNVKGCSHLTALLTSMVSAAFQGLAAHYLQKPSGLEFIADEMIHFLVNSCWAWREDSPIINDYKKQWLT